jgi:hypothetical protein
MPEIPDLLVSTGFVTASTKVVVNTANVRAVGGVCGIHNVRRRLRERLAEELRESKVAGEIVPHANGLRKLEINQLNALISRALKRIGKKETNA